MKNIGILIVSFTITLASCNNEKSSVSRISEKTTAPDSAFVLTDSLTYGVATHPSENVDSLESAEFNKFLQGDLIDYLFTEIYSGRLKTYDFFTEKELSIEEVKDMEKSEGFHRSKVGKVQFNEQWFVDKKGNLLKRVNSMTLGVERYSKQGTFVGYNALFKIKFNANVR